MLWYWYRPLCVGLRWRGLTVSVRPDAVVRLDEEASEQLSAHRRAVSVPGGGSEEGGRGGEEGGSA